ncbi:MAG: PspA/IM30 family protein [Magnetococcales bacterium]|nr:PspA/IM30 family protein [Magnetococcales bacterium]
MSSFLHRLFTWGKAEAHAAMDKLEDPTRMAEQGIRDLQADQVKAMEGLAQIKAQTVRLRRDSTQEKETATGYERKAMLLLQKAQSGALATAEAERLATEALAKRDGALERARLLEADLHKMEAMTAQLEGNVQKIRSQIGKWENELRSLKARAQVGQATRKLNEQLAKVNGDGTIAMLERMKDKVATEESLAEAYGDLAAVETSVDAEIDRVLSQPAAAADSLAALKQKMGL